MDLEKTLKKYAKEFKNLNMALGRQKPKND